jgi:hypothetical protein
MGRLHCVQWAFEVVTIFLFLLLPACGGHKPPGTNPFPAKINLNPAASASLQWGSTIVFTASAQNFANTSITATFTYASSNPSVLDVSPNGVACAGTWNAPYYNVCTPGQEGVALVTASALGSTSSPTQVFVHPPIDSIQISVVPPVNSPPPACPAQTALPAACNIPFNAAAANYCLSQNQVQTLQATAYSQGVDITASVGPFTWAEGNFNVVKVTPIVTSSTNVATDQATVVAGGVPGQTSVVASASGVASQPYTAETCPVQCIALAVGSQDSDLTSFIANKGSPQTITATAVDVQGCMVPKPPLTWTSSAPAALAASATACTAGTTCSISTAQAGVAAITASCTPPSCNIASPPIIAGIPTTIYQPQAVYPVNAISGLVSGASTSTTVLATSQDCYSNSLCNVALYNISTTKNLAANPTPLPAPPNSLMFDPAGDKAYAGSQYGALLITAANIGSSSTSPFSFFPAPATPLGVVTGKVIGVSPNGNFGVFSDTISTPNQVYVVNTSGSASTTALNINNATAAVFSPDNSKAFILGNGGNTLYVYSALQALQTLPALQTPADAIAFSSTGAFAFVAGGSSSSNISVYNTCNNSAVNNLAISGLPATPIFLKMVPSGNVPTGSSIIPSFQLPPLSNLDIFFGIDNNGIDVFATTTTTPLSPQPGTLCPMQQIALAQTTGKNPIYINLQKGTFHPINFFLSPDSTQVYIVTSDLGVLIYNFSTGSVSAIQLIGGAAPVSADMTADGALLYVAGTDGMLHQIITSTATDQAPPIFFTQLPNSSNNFCYESYTCALNLVGVRP